MIHFVHAYLRDLIDQSHDERGASGVEYGILIATIAAVIVAVALLLGQEIVAAFNIVLDALPG